MQAINSMGVWIDPSKYNTDGTFDASGIVAKHWSLDFTAPDGPRFRMLSEDEAHALRENAKALGSSGIFGDTCHFFKNAWHELENFSVSIEANVLNVYFNGQNWLIQSAKQAGDALETVFTRIMQGLKDLDEILENVLAWLKMLFNWPDILNTRNVLKAAINSTLSNLGNSMSGAEQESNQWYTQLKQKVTNAFDQLDVFADQSFNAFANAVDAPPPSTPLGQSSSGNVLAGTNQKQAYKLHSSQCNFAHRLAISAYAKNAVTTLSAPDVSDGSVSMDSIVNAYNKDIDQDTFSTKAATLQACFNNPSKFFDTGIADFCENGAQDLVTYVLEAADDIVDAAIKDIASASEAFKSVINASIHVPVLSWIYKNEITGSIEHPGDDLMILDLICLVNAIPATILCKLEAGSSAVQQRICRRHREARHSLAHGPFHDGSGSGNRRASSARVDAERVGDSGVLAKPRRRVCSAVWRRLGGRHWRCLRVQ